MITQKELQEIAIKEQERQVKQREHDFKDLCRWVEHDCKRAACKGLYETEFEISQNYQSLAMNLIDRLNEAGISVKIISTCPAYENLVEIININWEGGKATNE